MNRLWIVILALGLGCGSNEEEAPTPAPTPEAPATPQTEEPAEPEAEAEAEPALAGPAVDLLQAVATTVKVSSAYRDRSTQVPRLFDDDLQTAWNSASDDLVGAWIEITLPDDAQVDHLELTVGYLKDSDETDLFTGNQRVKKVKVTRNGEEVGSYDLNVDQRELQSVAAAGGGGTWRIEITEVQAGSRDDWKEICISELKVMGRAPGAEEDTRFPRYAIGDADPEAAPDAPGDLRLATHQLIDKWLQFQKNWIVLSKLEGGELVLEDEEDVSDMRREFRRLLEQALKLARDVPQADRIRRELVLERGPEYASYAAALDPVAAAIAARMEREDDEARCRWAKGHAHLRLGYITQYDGVLSGDSVDGDPDLWETLDGLQTAEEGFKADSRTTTRRLLALPAGSPLTDWAPQWNAMRAQLELAQQTCGWD